MAPNNQPPIAVPTPREYAVLGLTVSLDTLQAFTAQLPVPAGAIFALARNVIANVETVEGNTEECGALKDHVGQILPVVLATMEESKDGPDMAIPAQLSRHVERFHATLKEIDDNVTEVRNVINSKRKRDRIRAFFASKWYTRRLKKCKDDLDWAIELFRVTDQLENSVRTCHILHRIEAVGADVTAVGTRVEGVASQVERVAEGVTAVLNHSLLKSLPRAKLASFVCARADRRGGCFEGTRVGVIKTIREWVLNPDPGIPKCFCLSGIAGVGKTTVAYSIAEMARDLGVLGADFFFSRLGEDELRNPKLVFPTLAYQLALSDPEFARVIIAALERDPDAGFASLQNQYETLIIKPLSTLKRDPKRIVLLVFDAFDECEANGAKEILQLLVNSISKLPFFLKIFITTRPEQYIQSILLPSSNLSITALHDIENYIVASDIKHYLTTRLRGLCKEPGYERLGEDWITEAEIQLLVDAAGTLFVYAATSIRFLTDEIGLTPRELLDILLVIIQAPRRRHPSLANPYFDLDALYQQILTVLVSRATGIGAMIARRFQLVVGTIVVLRDPLPIAALSHIVVEYNEDTIMTLLSTLQSVILLPGTPDDCPRAYHPSFPDFLQDDSRCTDERLLIDTETHDTRLALRCLEILNASLHKNMLGSFNSCLLNKEISNLPERVSAAFPSELRYAVRHWAYHLARVSHPASSQIHEALALFAFQSLLPWFESLSWLDQTRSAVESLEAVRRWAARSLSCSSPCSTSTLGHLSDGYRLLAHLPTMDDSALHIARSVLPFALRNLRLASVYADYVDPNIKVVGGSELEGSACLMTLKGHTDWARSVSVSPDDTRIVSGAADNTLRIWNANTGASIAVLEGHTDVIRSVAFSPDGSQIVSGGRDHTVRLWDTTNGRELETLQGHGWIVFTVSFSPDGTRIASASGDRTIKIWDAVSHLLLMTLSGHTEEVGGVAFFQDGRRLVSSGDDGTVRVWDLTEETCIATFRGHSDQWVLAVVVSPDGQRIVSGSRDTTLRVWDVSSGNCISILQGHTDSIYTVAISPDGSRIASGSNDRSVRLWDATTFDNIAIYKGHEGIVSSVTFTHDSSRIVSASQDGTIKIWDAGAVQGEAEAESPRNPEDIVSIAFSSSKSRIAVLTAKATGVYRLSVHIRDSATPRGPDLKSFVFTGLPYVDRGSRVRFAANDTRIVVTSDDMSFVYDASSGTPLPDSEIPEPERSSGPLFTFEDRKIYRHSTSPPTLACILPPSLQVTDVASLELDGSAGHRVLVGSRDGRLVDLLIT